MTIKEAFNRYIEDYLTIRGYNPRQIELYSDTKRFLIDYLGNIEIEDITVQQICTWSAFIRDSRRLSQNTLSLYVSAIRQVLKWSKRVGVMCIDYELIPVPKRINKIPSYLTKDEVESLIDAGCGIRGKLIISMLYSSGLRVSELCQLNRNDIRDRQFAVVGKGKKMRICFIDDRTDTLLQAYLSTRTDRNNALILTRLKTRITPVAVQETVRGASRRAQITKKVTPHTLRHSFATNFLENNGNMRYLQELLGHSSLSTTQMYTHVTNNNLKTAYMSFHTI